MSKEIGNRIKQLRMEKSMSQQQLASALGVSPSAVSNYEQGTRVPKSNTLQLLVDTLDTTAQYVLWGTENKKSASVTRRLTAEEFALFKEGVRRYMVSEPAILGGELFASIPSLTDDEFDDLMSSFADYCINRAQQKNEK